QRFSRGALLEAAFATQEEGSIPESQNSRLHVDRTAGGHRHYRDPGGDTVAGAAQSQGQGARHLLPKQPSPASALLAPVCGRQQSSPAANLDLADIERVGKP